MEKRLPNTSVYARHEKPMPARGRQWSLLSGVAALIVYLLTISRGAYPGSSAALVASAAQLIPESLPDHPFWSFLTRGLAQCPVLALPVRLNLFSALCGSAAVSLFGLLISRFLFQAAHENARGSQLALPPEDDGESAGAHPVARANPAVRAFNRHVAFAAQMGGWAAAAALAFSVPFWSAATRLQYQTFDALFLLVILHLAALYATTLRRALALAAAFLCGAGCIESAVFIPLSAVLFVLLPVLLIRRDCAWERTLLFALMTAAAGASTNLLVLLYVHSSAPLAIPVGLRSLALDLLRAHYGAIRYCLPHTGWLGFVLLAFVPAAAILLTARSSLSTRPSFGRIVLHLLFLITTLLCLFNAPLSPWGVARNSGYLPVMAYLAVSMVAGYLVVFWHLLGVTGESELDRRLLARRGLTLSIPLRRWLGSCVGWPFLVTICIFPLVNLLESDGRQGAFADAVARETMTQLGEHDWVASDGLLDSHLLLAAHAQRRPLHLLSLSAGTSPLHIRQLQAWIDAKPAFAATRGRLHQAARLGIQPFLEEWLRDASSAKRDLAFIGTSLIWKKAGWQPVPNGLGYTGANSLNDLRGTDLLGPNRVVWVRMETALAPAAGAPPALERLRLAIRQQAGRCANDLGVLLQDQGRGADAFEAYDAARTLDPENLSALFNQSFLTKNGVHANDKDAIAKALRSRLAKPLPPIAAIMDLYGDIRDANALVSEGRAWSLRGQTSLAKAEFDRSLALDPGSTNAQRRLATLYLTQGNTTGSEHACRAMLAANPADKQAMIGLASVALTCGRADDAHQWLNRARAAGASEDELAICDASWLLLAGQSDEALAKLHAVTDRHPEDIEAWSLLADVLFRRNALAEIEQRVLPSMCKAAGKTDHVLIHLVRAQLRCHQQPVDFTGARASYLRALALRPDLAGARHDLLALDLRSGSTALMEQDAGNVLRADPDDAFANYLLATVLLGRDELTGAEDHYRRSLATHRTAEALNDLAETLRRQRRLPEAEKSAREALAQSPKTYQLWDTLGCILTDAGRADEAAQAVEKALALCETDARLYVSLARVRIAQSRLDDARRTLREISARFDPVPANVKPDIAALERKLSPVITVRP